MRFLRNKLALVLAWVDEKRGVLPRARGDALDRIAMLWGIERRWWESDRSLRRRLLSERRVLH